MMVATQLITLVKEKTVFGDFFGAHQIRAVTTEVAPYWGKANILN